MVSPALNAKIGHEYLLAFSGKRRHFCPSCHQKRVVEFGEWLCEEILKAVPHRHFTFSLPKILRRYFLYDRKLLSELSRCAWDSLEVFLLSFPPKQETAPGAVIAIQTFGDFLNFNPHCHGLCTDGAFYGSGSFKVAPALDTKPLEKLFQHKVLGMLLRKGKIKEEVVKLIMSWRHSGFNVHCGPRIQPGDEEAMENLARYVVRASFSQESPPWRDTFAYCRLGRCIIETLTFQVLRIGDRSGPGDDLPSR